MRASKKLTVLLLAAALLLTSCGGGGAKATTMRLKRTEGTVGVSDDGGKDIKPREDLGLYSGYGVDTRSESYAWIDLDEVKLTKLDQDSEIEIQKAGKALEIIVNEGSLFFNVIQPLAEDETMTIRTSSMMVGIRGTCGWVEMPDGDTMRVFLLEGRVHCEVDGEHETVRAGEMATMTEDGSITVEQFTAADIPAFVMEEVEDDDDLAGAILDDSGIDMLNPETPEPVVTGDPAADALAWYRYIVNRPEDYFGTREEGYTVTGNYRYALVQMQRDDPVPTLLLGQEYIDNTGPENLLYGTAVLPYNPAAGTVIRFSTGFIIGRVPSDLPDGDYVQDLALAADGNGLVSSVYRTVSGSQSYSRCTPENSQLEMTMLGQSANTIEIIWYDISNLSPLDSWTPPDPTPMSEPSLPTDGDRIVFTGTIDTYTYDEVLALQGISDPNAGYDHTGHTFRLIVLDTPQNMSLNNLPDSKFRESMVSMIDVSYADGLAQYDGQHMIFSIDPAKTGCSHGTDLPLGEPSTRDVHVLG